MFSSVNSLASSTAQRFPWIYVIVLFIFSACGTETPSEEDVLGMQLRGEAQGTTYNITYLGDTANYQPQIDSILKRFDHDLSLWDPNSLIQQINRHQRRDTVFAFFDTTRNFTVVFELAREVFKKTDGAFDPTVYPLVQAWGFGLEKRQDIKDELVDSLLQNVGFSEFNIDLIDQEENYVYLKSHIWKGKPGSQLDFNGIAQGYSVDLIADFLQMQGIGNYMVELGGELICKGHNVQGRDWRIAIDKPEAERKADQYQSLLEVHDKAVATSGNYRNFYETDGQRYAHTLDPRTGYPVQHNLLSVTVVANSCAMADAYATAFMVLGLDESMRFLEENPALDLEAFFVMGESENYRTQMTPGFKAMQAEEIKN